MEQAHGGGGGGGVPESLKGYIMARESSFPRMDTWVTNFKEFFRWRFKMNFLCLWSASQVRELIVVIRAFFSGVRKTEVFQCFSVSEGKHALLEQIPFYTSLFIQILI